MGVDHGRTGIAVFFSFGISLREETCKGLGQSIKLERLPQQGPIAVALPDVVTAVSGHEGERNAAGGECVGDPISFVAVQIHIEQSGVENLSVDPGEGLIDCGD